MRYYNKDFNDDVIVGLVLSAKGPNLSFRCLGQEAVNYPDREEACFAMMEKGPAYGAWNEFCYVPVDKRLALGEAVQPTDIIVCLSQRVAGLSVEKIMIVFATMYYSEFLDSSNVSCKRRCELLKKILNADKEIANLPCLLIDAMNETFFTNN